MSARNFENARKIAREAAFAHARANGRGESIDDSDRAIGIAAMSNLLWDVPAWEGGFLGLSDAAFDALCEEHRGTVSREIALNAQWARTVTWPRDAEDVAERVRWRDAYTRNVAGRAAHPEPADPQPAAIASEHIALTTQPRSSPLKPHDRVAARALAASIDRVLGFGRAHDEAA
jgi:hypothetical protein